MIRRYHTPVANPARTMVAGQTHHPEHPVKMELALILAEATARQLGSIRQSRRDGIDFDKVTLRWQPLPSLPFIPSSYSTVPLNTRLATLK
jgi:hypothetical protein